MKPESLHWIDEQNLELEDLRFFVTVDPARFSGNADASTFLLLKAREQISRYAALATSLRAEHVFEIGIMYGGSTVLFERLFRPRRMVGIDHGSGPLPALERYIRERGLGRTLRIYFGVDQADVPTLRRIGHDDFDGCPLDLVIDDASHFLRETKASFNTLFPQLRPGGCYSIEDWGWAHWSGVWQTDQSFFAGMPAMSDLVFELVMAAASRPDAVAAVEVTANQVLVTRGDAALGSDFDISKSYFIHDRRDIGAPFRDTAPGG